MTDRYQRRFLLWSGITVTCLYLVILAGSVVRATGSGMGCPDWPKCFGYYIPPTHPSQLDFHSDHPYKKGVMIIVNDTLFRAPVNFISGPEFNRADWEKYPAHNYAKFFVAQTWTEYINRLFGALSGMTSLVLIFFSVKRRKYDKISLAAVITHFVVLGFVAWLGKVVVDSNLKPATVTAHMLCALVMVFLMVFVRARTVSMNGKPAEFLADRKQRLILFLLTALTLAQIVIGTQVRQQIDTLNAQSEGQGRDSWISGLSSQYTLHISLAILIAAANIYFWFANRKKIIGARPKLLLHLNLLIVLAAYGAGVVLHRFGVPAAVQPVHLFLAMGLAGVQFGLVMRTR